MKAEAWTCLAGPQPDYCWELAEVLRDQQLELEGLDWLLFELGRRAQFFEEQWTKVGVVKQLECFAYFFNFRRALSSQIQSAVQSLLLLLKILDGFAQANISDHSVNWKSLIATITWTLPARIFNDQILNAFGAKWRPATSHNNSFTDEFIANWTEKSSKIRFLCQK